MPGSERHNRGGMSLEELLSKTKKSNARALLVVSISQGNPRNIQVISSEGKELLTITMESAALRREVLPVHRPRITSLQSVLMQPNCSSQTLILAKKIAKLMGVEISDSNYPNEIINGKGQVFPYFSDLAPAKTLWTHYYAFDKREIGPRIRVSSVSGSNNR